MIIINSAAYVVPEFRNEFGLIPPTFLPIGNRKLLSFQVEYLRKSFPTETIFLSLPKLFELNLDDKKLLQTLNVKPVFIEEGLSLGMALLYLLNTISYNIDETLRLLHGDTLLENFPTDSDCIGLAKTKDDYQWEFEKNTQNALVWCGYFSFASIRSFIKALATTQGKFTEAVHRYSNEKQCTYHEMDSWFDFGHINTYFQSRSTITTQRAFNHLKIGNGIVWKSGSPSRKIEAESNWFKNLPVSLKRFAPQLIQSGYLNEKPFYETEFLPYLPLNEIFVHGKNPPIFWENILGLIAYYMDESRKASHFSTELTQQIHKDSIALYKDKTIERLTAYSKETNLDLTIPVKYNGINLPCLEQIAQEAIDATLSLPEIPTVLHGDLCFSNIMYDSRSNAIKVIDPRGMNAKQEMSIYGNQSYDLAKLCHSFVGLYDFIIADAFTIKESKEFGVKLIFNIDTRLEEIQQIFLQKQLLPNIKNNEIIPPTILLFLSMIPLHFDKPNRQKAMLANAMRLYTMWKEV